MPGLVGRDERAVQRLDARLRLAIRFRDLIVERLESIVERSVCARRFGPELRHRRARGGIAKRRFRGELPDLHLQRLDVAAW